MTIWKETVARMVFPDGTYRDISREEYYKLATPEQPEWKIAPVPQALLDLAEMERKARQEVCGITDLMRGVSPSADRALSDFIAKRKAKREKPDIEEFFEGSQWTADEVERLKALNEQLRQDRLLCEAMSAPLPHDPPISARLMPWRGKE